MRILVFLHGTTIMHAAGVGCAREERVQQSHDRHPSIFDYAAYAPIGAAPAKLRHWQAQGAVIVYLSSHRKPEDVAKDATVLASYSFPDGAIVYRQHGEDYGAVAERVWPDVLIEDDCESIGNLAEMTYPKLSPDARRHIRSFVVPEFGGIDHLPDDLEQLGAR